MRSKQYRPSVAPLESRLALSGITASLEDGRLVVQGTREAEPLAILVEQGGIIVVSSTEYENTQIAINGSYEPVPVEALDAILVKGGKGDDRFGLYNLDNTDLGGLDIILDGGQGDDLIRFFGRSTVSEGSELNIRMLGGQGDDRIELYDAWDVDGVVNVHVEGGPGSDTITDSRVLNGIGTSILSIEAGPGDDTVSHLVTYRPDEVEHIYTIEDGPGQDVIIDPR